jgi:hypothetical protein
MNFSAPYIIELSPPASGYDIDGNGQHLTFTICGLTIVKIDLQFNNAGWISFNPPSECVQCPEYYNPYPDNWCDWDPCE